MPKTKEEIKEYKRLYQIKNKDKIKQWRIDNKEKIKQYRIDNKDKKSLYQKTEQGKKVHRIGQWKYRGILCFDYNLLYDLFVSTTKCEFCNIQLTTGRYNTSTTRCLDHDHSINDKFNIRGVLCNSCNRKDVLKTTT